MIRKASELAPDDASITDSLGWAQFKRGKVDEAIDDACSAPRPRTRRRPRSTSISAMPCSPSGRRYEARFAWNAALVTAEDDIARRVRAKIEHGLTPANAAP